MLWGCFRSLLLALHSPIHTPNFFQLLHHFLNVTLRTHQLFHSFCTYFFGCHITRQFTEKVFSNMSLYELHWTGTRIRNYAARHDDKMKTFSRNVLSCFNFYGNLSRFYRYNRGFGFNRNSSVIIIYTYTYAFNAFADLP